MPDSTAETALTLERAFAAHQQWIVCLQEAINLGISLDVATIRRDDCCELGKWLQRDGLRQYGHRPEFTRLVGKHASFHLVASVIAGIINARNPATAASVLKDHSHFAIASTEVDMAITALRKAVGS